MTTCSHHHVFVPAEGIFFCRYYLFDCVLWWFFKRFKFPFAFYQGLK